MKPVVAIHLQREMTLGHVRCGKPPPSCSTLEKSILPATCQAGYLLPCRACDSNSVIPIYGGSPYLPQAPCHRDALCISQRTERSLFLVPAAGAWLPPGIPQTVAAGEGVLLLKPCGRPPLCALPNTHLPAFPGRDILCSPFPTDQALIAWCPAGSYPYLCHPTPVCTTAPVPDLPTNFSWKLFWPASSDYEENFLLSLTWNHTGVVFFLFLLPSPSPCLIPLEGSLEGSSERLAGTKEGRV